MKKRDTIIKNHNKNHKWKYSYYILKPQSSIKGLFFSTWWQRARTNIQFHKPKMNHNKANIKWFMNFSYIIIIHCYNIRFIISTITVKDFFFLLQTVNNQIYIIQLCMRTTMFTLYVVPSITIVFQCVYECVQLEIHVIIISILWSHTHCVWFTRRVISLFICTDQIVEESFR